MIKSLLGGGLVRLLQALDPIPEKALVIDAAGNVAFEDRLLDKTFLLGITCATNPSDLLVNITTNDCRYDKIGKRLFVSVNIGFTLTYTTAAGQVLFTGFPFTAETGNTLGLLNFQSGSAFVWPVSSTQIAMAVQSGANTAVVQGNKSNSTVTNLAVTAFTSGTPYVLRFRGEYKAA